MRTVAVFITGSLLLPLAGATAAVRCIDPDKATGTSLAVVVDPAPLAHTAQLLPLDAAGAVIGKGDAAKQTSAVLAALDAALKEAGSSLRLAVKLNVYLGRPDVMPTVRAALARRFDADMKPASCFVVSALPHPDALVAMDAVATCPGAGEGAVQRFRSAAVLPAGGVVYVSGQAEKGALKEATLKTLESLQATLKHLGLDRSRVVSIKSFLQPMSNVAAAREVIRAFFDGAPPPMVFVEWTMSGPVEIELVAAAPGTATAAGTVDYLTPPGMKPSPVYSRVARINHGRHVFISGLYCAEAADAGSQLRGIFAELGRLLKAAGSDFKHMAKATYYVADEPASKKLNEIRPEFYDPQRPPAASKAPVKSVGLAGRTVTIDMIAATADAPQTNLVTKGRYKEFYGDTGKEPKLDPAKDLPHFPAVEPNDAPQTFQIKKGFKVELAAHEPQVRDPIAVSFDENGRMFVVEMVDYSEMRDEKPHWGRVRLLEDKDGDGCYETSTVFAADLPWPTAVIACGGGAFVGATPDILWLKDTDGDGKADVREVVFTGFGTGLKRLNVQALINCFNWGLDNRLHVQCGSGNRGVIRCLKRPDLQPQELGGRDFWFDPRTFEFGLEAGGGQYGFSYDTRGRKFVCNNSDHLRVFLYSDRYAARNPHYSMPSPLRSIAADGGAAEVFRISPDEPWRIVRTRWRVSGVVKGVIEGGGRVSGYFTGGSGTTVYRGDAYGPEFLNNTFSGDVGGNLVHRKVITPDGVSLIGRRPADEQTFEFLASRDTWFRPANFANAPDGCLHVIDMYREFIEHPWSIPESIKQHLNLNSGNDRGRIYRVVPENFKRRPAAALGKAGTAELVATLAHPNGWHRDCAARLLYERQDKAAVPLLEKLSAAPDSPLGRMHALHVLDGLGALREAVVLKALADGDGAVREHAVLLSEKLRSDGAPSAALWAALKKLVADPDPVVRFQLAFTVGEMNHAERPTVLAAIARRDAGDLWISAAVLSAPPAVTGALFAELSRDEKFAASGEGGAFLRQLVQVIGAKNDAAEVAAVLDWLTRGHASATLVSALGDGLRRGGSSLAKADKAGQLKSVFADAAKTAADAKAAAPARAQAVSLLGLTSFAVSGTTLTACLAGGQPESVQLAAVTALGRFRDAAVSAPLLQNWKSFSLRARSEAINVLLARPERSLALLQAIQSGQVKASDLDSVQEEFLQKHKDKQVAALAAKVIPVEEKVPRAQVVAKFTPALTLKGDAGKGRAIYTERCISCHRAESQGHQLGPDFVTVKTAGREKLLTNILDPNREVAPQYLTYTIETRDGESYSGLISSDTPASVTLRQAFGKEDVVPRSNIKKMASGGLSLMPENLEANLTPQQLADLLEFIETLK
ncbi:MAG: c-type cytochrome [Verrucomicrobia bacterium]|nr:c-type cytochrome [Verrucomicrobiota bacterium]